MIFSGLLSALPVPQLLSLSSLKVCGDPTDRSGGLGRSLAGPRPARANMETGHASLGLSHPAHTCQSRSCTEIIFSFPV